MKTKLFLHILFCAFVSHFFVQCKKADTITVLEGIPVIGSGKVDASWTFDKPHGNVNWETAFYDFSSTMLTGRFDNYGFNPKLIFDEANLSSTSLHFWVQLSTFNSGEPGRDGPGKCGRSYLGVTYLDSAKTKVDPASDTAWFHSQSVVRSGTGYVVKGNFSLNRYRPASGYPDKTPITKPVTIFLTYNGMADFDTDGDGKKDRYRAGFTAHFSFNRSDYMDKKAAIQWVPVPTIQDKTGNTVAINNTTYGAWSSMVADEMNITINTQLYKNH